MENIVIIGIFIVVGVAVLLGLGLLFTKGIMYLADGWANRMERGDSARYGKILKTRLSLIQTLPKSKDATKPPYESSAVVVYTKSEFMRMASYWWDHRVPGQADYDKFEAVAQP